MADRAQHVLLAEKWDTSVDPTDWWMSEKLDGVRAYWNGSNFYSRLGNMFPAPDWFKAKMPKDTLDGELWCGRKQFQKCVSIVKNTKKGEEWKNITYLVFDSPDHKGTFEERQAHLKAIVAKLKGDQVFKLVGHKECEGMTDLNKYLKETEKLGGEGLMLRKPGSLYEWKRSKTLLKVKTFHDEEGIVTGHKPGEGRNAHRMGALEVKTPDGRVFHVGSGFTDKQRDKPPKIGSVITYRYQELSNSGKPRFPTYVGDRIDIDWDTYKKNYVPPTITGAPALKKHNSVLFTSSAVPSIIDDDDVSSSSAPLAGKKHSRDDSSDPATAPAGKKKMCKYGIGCYRKNAQHLADFDHPPPTDVSVEGLARCATRAAADISEDRDHLMSVETDEESPAEDSSNPTVDVTLVWVSGATPDGGEDKRMVLEEGLNIVGRGTMGVLDTALSRRQLELRVSHDPVKVSIKQIGRNTSQVKRAGDADFVDLIKDVEVEVFDGDEIALLVTKSARMMLRIG